MPNNVILSDERLSRLLELSKGGGFAVSSLDAFDAFRELQERRRERRPAHEYLDLQYQCDALAAKLQSLREPTDAMLAAGAATLPDYDPGTRDAGLCWLAMVNVALADDGKAPAKEASAARAEGERSEPLKSPPSSGGEG